MTILFTSYAKSNVSNSFGQGLLRSHPTYQASFTQADIDWLAADEQARRDIDAEVEMMALEAQAIERLSQGYDA